MADRIRSRLTYANVMSTLAVFLLLGGGAWAVKKIGSKNIKKNAVHSKHIKRNQVKSSDIKRGAVKASELATGAVNGAAIRNGTITDADLAPGEAPHVVGTVGEPALRTGGEGDCLWSVLSVSPGTLKPNPASFYKDSGGRVHLDGTLLGADGPGGDTMCDSGLNAESIEDQTMFVLPAAYRPANLIIDVDGGGDGILVSPASGGTNAGGTAFSPGAVIAAGSGIASLDGLSFLTAEAAGTAGAVAGRAAGGGEQKPPAIPALSGG